MQRFLRRLYSYFRRYRAEWFHGSLRDWNRITPEVIRESWESRFHERVMLVSDQIKISNPASVLEVGCGCGNVLYHLAKANPMADLQGVDTNALAVECGMKWLRDEKIANVHLQVGRAQDLSLFPDQSYDIVYSSAALMYVRPQEIKDVLKSMLRIARKSVLLLELHGEALCKDSGEFYLPNNWKRNYITLFHELGIQRHQITVEPVPERIWSPGGGGGAILKIFHNPKEYSYRGRDTDHDELRL